MLNFTVSLILSVQLHNTEPKIQQENNIFINPLAMNKNTYFTLKQCASLKYN